MATPAAGSPGDNKAWLDGAAVAFPITIDATHNEFGFDGDEYVVPQQSSAIQGGIITFPVTIDSTHKQFSFGGNEYVIATGVYEDAYDLVHAVRNALTGGTTKLSTVVDVERSAGGLLLTIQGIHTSAIATGASNDCLARIGLTNSTALAAAPEGTCFHPGDVKRLCHILNGAIQAGDSSRLDANTAHFVPSPFVDGGLRLAATVAGVDTRVVTSGTDNDVLAAIGFTDSAALDNGA